MFSSDLPGKWHVEHKEPYRPMLSPPFSSGFTQGQLQGHLTCAVPQQPTHTQKDLTLGLTLCCAESLNALQTRGLHLHCTLGPSNSTAGPAPDSPISSPMGVLCCWPNPRTRNKSVQATTALLKTFHPKLTHTFLFWLWSQLMRVT